MTSVQGEATLAWPLINCGHCNKQLATVVLEEATLARFGKEVNLEYNSTNILWHAEL